MSIEWMNWMSKRKQKTLEPLLKKFEAGEIPTELTNKQKELLLETYGDTTDASFPFNFDCIREGKWDVGMKELTAAFNKAKAYAKNNKLHGAMISVLVDEVNVYGIEDASDKELLATLKECWVMDKNSTPVLKKEVERLQAQVKKLTSKAAKKPRKKTKKAAKKGKAK